MKLISLNTYGGRFLGPLLNFIKEKSADTDIFCFQEVFSGGEKEVKLGERGEANLLERIREILPGHVFIHQPGALPYRHYEQVITDIPRFGNATFIKKDIQVLGSEGFLTYPVEEKKEYPLDLEAAGILLDVDVKKDDKEFSIANIHGLWGGGPKDDNLARLFQSRRVLECLRSKKSGKVLIGDFNLRPETESIAMIEQEMLNLIKENEIQTTRNKNYALMEKFHDYIADYCFVSKNVTVEDFRVLPDIVSDHQPLYLEFS